MTFTAFKKIDQDAVNNDEPFDTFLLQGIASNVTASSKLRYKKCGHTFVIGEEPILSYYAEDSLWAVWPICIFPVGDKFNSIKVEIYCDVQDSNIYVKPCLLRKNGKGIYNVPTSEQNLSVGTNQIITLEYNLPQKGGTYILGMMIRSSLDVPSKQSYTFSAPHDVFTTIDQGKLDLTGAGFTMTTSKRYALLLSPIGATAPEINNARTLMVLDHGTSDNFVKTYPMVNGLGIGSDSYSFDLEAELLEIGAMKVFGYSIYETDFNSSRDLTNILGYNQGYVPSTFIISQLYAENLENHKNNVPIFNCGGTVDRNHTDAIDRIISPIGSLCYVGDTSWRTIGSTMVSNKFQDVVDYQGNEVERTRTKVGVLAFCAASGPTLHNYRLNLAVRTRWLSFDNISEEWDDEEEYLPDVYGSKYPTNIISDYFGDGRETLIALEYPLDQTSIPDIYNSPSWHALRGLIPLSAFERDPDNPKFSYIEFEVDDTDTNEDRMCLLQIGGGRLVGDTGNLGSHHHLYCWVPTFSLWTIEDLL